MQSANQPPEPPRSEGLLSVRRCGQVTTTLWALLVGLWLFDITGRGPETPGLAAPGLGGVAVKGCALAAFIATGCLAVVAIRQLLRPPRRRWGMWLLVLLVVAVGVGFAGLGHEVGDGYYTDEGHYLHRAQLVNSGQIFHRSMIYPHLLYYRDGFSLWLAELFPGSVAGLAKGLYGVDEGLALPWLVLRWVNAALAVSTLLPVFLTALRLGGRLAAVLAGVLIIFSAHYHDGFHVNICDVPSAVFAAWTFYFVALLAEKETLRRYLWAGVTAALAAAAKYPAGMVATAIVGVWLLQRWRRRDWSWGLLAAGSISLATFLFLNPSLLVYPQATLLGDRGLFFGVRQYSQGGWIGVMPTSNSSYYWQQLRHNFGAPVLALALLGGLGLSSAVRRRVLALAIFPLAFWILICSMNMVVVRNLFPLIPPLAIFLGVGLAGTVTLAQRWIPTSRSVGVAAALIFLVLLPTVWRTTRQAVAMTQPSTRQLMSNWMLHNVPRGASLLKESYTPNFQQVWFPSHELRFLLRFPQQALSDPATDFALLASQAHGRFFRPEHQTEMQADWYRRFFAQHDEVHSVAPGSLRLGPRLMLYRLRQDLGVEAETQRTADQAFLPNQALATGNSITFQREGQFALFKVPRPKGWQRVSVTGEGVAAEGVAGEVIAGELLVRDMANREVIRLPLQGGGAALELASEGKYFFYFYLQPGSRLLRVQWSAVDASKEAVALEEPVPSRGAGTG